jgi:calcium release-activated calcium channel protein 1
LQQRVLDNARVLWNRFVEKNRRDVEERAEQLKSIGNMAALVAGFAVVAFLEFQAEWAELSTALAAAFGFSTALVVRF